MQPAPDVHGVAATPPHAATRTRLGRWLDAHEVVRRGRVRPRGALLTVALVYLVGFGIPVHAAIRAVTEHPSYRDRPGQGTLGWTLPVTLELSLNALAFVIAIPLLLREAPTWARPVGPRSRWLRELQAFGLGLVAMFAGGVALRLLGWLPHPILHNTWSGWPGVVAVLLAGPAEEIVVLVVPLVFLRAARWPWWAVIVTMLVLRLAYHVYYGFPVLGFSVWAVAMILIYLRAHAVIGLIVAHSFWDSSIMLGTRWPPVGGLLASFTMLGLVVWGIVSLILWLVERSDRRRAARVVPTPIGWYQNSTGHWWWWDGQRWIAPPPAPYTSGEVS